MTQPSPSPFRPTALDRRDLGLIGLVLALLGLYIWRTFDWSLPLYEDAAILMRYARHMAEGHGIVWNIGEKPVDGATDFFLMVSTAALAKVGFSIEGATYFLGFASHILTILLVYAAARGLVGGPRWTAFLAAAFFAFGPGIRYVEAYFGTPYFGLFSAASWYVAIAIVARGLTLRRSILFAVLALLLGLTRPEGVLLAVFFLAAIVAMRGWRASLQPIGVFAFVYGVLGGAYFLWRWRHFGYPLPNTYYIKGGKTLHWGHLEGGVKHLIALTLPILPILAAATLAEAVAWWSGKRTAHARTFAFFLLPVVLFTLAGVLHEGLMDYLHRFQYCLVPVVLMGWPLFLARLQDLARGPIAPSRFQCAIGTTFATVFLAGSLFYDVETYPTGGHRWWGTYNVAKILADYSPDHTIAVTNAGHLPYVSRWRAVDGWGLNDQEIAHDGLSAKILDRYRPDVIQFDGSYTPMTGPISEATPWGKATAVMKEYAESHGYTLAAAFGVTPYKAHYYFVRPDCPEHDELVRRIRAVDYYIGGAPVRCFDFSARDRG